MKITFIGDTSFSGVFSQRCAVDETVLEFLRDSDAVVINLEGICTDTPPRHAFSKNGARPLVSPADAWLKLKNILPANTEIFVNLCNNHAFDAGPEEVYKTIKRCKIEDWHWMGAGRNITEASAPVSLNDGICCVTMIAVAHQEGALADEMSPGVFSDSDMTLIKEKIAKARTTADYVIVNYHGGEEFTFVPLPPRRKLLHSFIELGADAVVAHHPHVVQGYEVHNGKYIFYSLGNFIFDTPYIRSANGTDESVIVKLELLANKISYEILSTKVDLNSASVLVDRHNKKFVEFTDSNYKKKWHADAQRLLGQRIRKITHSTFNKESKHELMTKFPICIQRLVRIVAGPIYLFFIDMRDCRYRYLWLGTIAKFLACNNSDKES